MTELERIALLGRIFGAQESPARLVGIGDDAALVSIGGPTLVWTIDAQVEGTHFRREWIDWEDVGWRSFMAAASDLAAMGATPVAALSALSLAASVDDAALEALARGQAAAAEAVGAPIVGGNLARGTETSVTTTLVGRVEKAVLRGGARPGDGLYLAGALGVAAAGLAALARGEQSPVDAHVAACIDAWRRPRARIADGLAMAPLASAAIDLSDGLAGDARHLAEASGARLVLEEAALRMRTAGALDAVATLLGRDALDLVLLGGEDYALLVASPSAIAGFERVGRVESGAAEVVLEMLDGSRSVVAQRGFDHFAAE